VLNDYRKSSYAAAIYVKYEFNFIDFVNLIHIFCGGGWDHG